MHASLQVLIISFCKFRINCFFAHTYNQGPKRKVWLLKLQSNSAIKNKSLRSKYLYEYICTITFLPCCFVVCLAVLMHHPFTFTGKLGNCHTWIPGTQSNSYLHAVNMLTRRSLSSLQHWPADFTDHFKGFLSTWPRYLSEPLDAHSLFPGQRFKVSVLKSFLCVSLCRSVHLPLSSAYF